MNCNQYNKKDYTSDDIRSGIMSALYELYRRDKALLSINANERSITHRFAVYIEKQFPDWNVDCEYNRDGEVPKEISLSEKTSCKVLPDIIVHKRGRAGPNLIVIEAKKNENSDLMKYKEKDKEKITGYIATYKYKSGLFINFNVTAFPLSANLDWYDGNKWDNEVINFEFDQNKFIN